MNASSIGKICLLLSIALASVQVVAQSQSNVDEAIRDLHSGKPLPGLPDLRKPVFLAQNSFVCTSQGALANPNKDILLLTKACVMTDKKMRVNVLSPRSQEGYINSHVSRVIEITWRSSAMSDATAYSGWVSMKNLSN